MIDFCIKVQNKVHYADKPRHKEESVNILKF